MSEGCQKKIISTEKAPKVIGPYSAGVKVSHFVYTAGQLGLDPATDNLVTGGVEAETRQALQNLKAILEAADAKLEDVVKTTVFLKDMNDFQKMNGIYAEFFASDAPARSAVQVAALPKGGAVEIEAVAFISSETCDCC
jgi:2-iminobutanoate/2-iminopropanoate deaminase